MKVFNIVMKVVVALAAVAGAVYLAATYGERIVAWAKKTLNCGKCECECDCDCDCECDCECDGECECECCCDETVEEVVEEEAEAPAEEAEVVAAEGDFEG